jgi:hypothetical protein
MSLMFAVAVFFLILELTCYAIVYIYLYAHDTSMLQLAIISQDAYKVFNLKHTQRKLSFEKSHCDSNVFMKT